MRGEAEGRRQKRENLHAHSSVTVALGTPPPAVRIVPEWGDLSPEDGGSVCHAIVSKDLAALKLNR
ncbi:MAG: hypothetical protein LBR80_18040 [Deltaproteobacteria bacterium]|jgi:hypothetical protein|nr:hypothetical protein [Deltaproteobacteria bacterium]